jgi:putative PIN family toxin of toxin-antitoxin system
LRKLTPKIKVFVDTSVLISGLASSTGASGAVLDLCEAEVIQMVISQQVIVEADRNFSAKLPRLLNRFRQFIRDLNPLMADDPSFRLVKEAIAVVGRKDASILAAAQEGQVDYLITLDKKHFLSSRGKKKIALTIVTPSEFLRIFEDLYLVNSRE